MYFMCFTVEDNWEIAPKDDKEIINRNCMCCYNCCKGRLFVPWLKFQYFFYLIASEPLFDLFITFCIVLNTIIMATEHHGMPEELKTTQRISNYVSYSNYMSRIVKKSEFLPR